MLVRYLSRDGLRVRQAASPELALAALAEATDAVVVLDLTMPGLDPRRIRQALTSPVVLLVAPGPRPRGLNRAGAARNQAGTVQNADTRRWLTRPFAPRQLVATVREMLDASDPAPSKSAAIPTVGGLRLGGASNGASNVAVIDGRDVPLTGKEFAILAALLTAAGRPCPRSQLLAATGSNAAERSVDVHIAALRAKLGASDLIRTVRGAGFMITKGNMLYPFVITANYAHAELGRWRNMRGQSPGHRAGGATIGGATLPI
jgi:DNA-binding response OmpR family regulator